MTPARKGLGNRRRCLVDREGQEIPVNVSPTVGQVMSRRVFAVCVTDTIQRVADLMEWKHIRHVPVEDKAGVLVGVVTYRTLLHMLGLNLGDPIPVGEVMKSFPVTVFPETPLIEALHLMQATEVGCFPVIEPLSPPNPKLVGIVTGSDFIALSAQLLDDWLRD